MNQAIEASLNEGLSMEEPVEKPLEDRVRRGETCVLLPSPKLTAAAHETTQKFIAPSLFGYPTPARHILRWYYMPSTSCRKFGKPYATIFQCRRQLKWVKYFWAQTMPLSLQPAVQVRPCLLLQLYIISCIRHDQAGKFGHSWKHLSTCNIQGCPSSMPMRLSITLPRSHGSDPTRVLEI